VDTEFHKESGKPPLDLMHFNAVLEEGRVAGYGASKYSERNWEEHADSWRWGQLLASAMRHIIAWSLRNDIDPESGCHHLAHARWNLGAIYELQLAGRGKDDRSTMMSAKKEVAEEPSSPYQTVDPKVWEEEDFLEYLRHAHRK